MNLSIFYCIRHQLITVKQLYLLKINLVSSIFIFFILCIQCCVVFCIAAVVAAFVPSIWPYGRARPPQNPRHTRAPGWWPIRDDWSCAADLRRRPLVSDWLAA